MKQVENSMTSGGGAPKSLPRRLSADVVVPLLLGACPTTALVLAAVLPQSGPITWGAEVAALGTAPSLIAVLDVSASDWRSSGPERLRPFWLLGRLLALALAVLAVISAVKVSTPNILYGDGSGAGELGWLSPLAIATITCAAFIPGSYARQRTGSSVVAGILACTGFWLPLAVVLTVQVAGPNDGGGPFVIIAYYVCGLLLVGMVASVLILGPLIGLLGGRLLRSR